MSASGRCKLVHIFAGALTAGLASGCVGSQPTSSPWGIAKGRQKGTPWTILCLEMEGSFRQVHLDQIAATFKQTPGIRPEEVHVIHDADGRSKLYYGTYLRRKDPKTGKLPIPANMRRDFELVQQLGDESGRRYFAKALIVRKPLPDVGNPEWMLGKSRGAYSLQVAAFEPTDEFWDFKQAAAEYCQWLREKGYEAYYHHGPSCSIVTVGSFGPSAVIPSERGLPKYSEEVLALQQDSLLKYNLLNGGIVRARVSESSDVVRFNMFATGNGSTAPGEAVPIYSRLVPVPHADPSSTGSP